MNDSELANIFKISGYLIDANGDYSAESIQSKLEEGIYDATGLHIKVEKASFEWDDDLPINRSDCPIKECDKYFLNQEV